MCTQVENNLNRGKKKIIKLQLIINSELYDQLFLTEVKLY